MSLSPRLMVPLCAAILLSLAACSHGPAGLSQSTSPPSATAGAPASKPAPPMQPPPPTSDQRLAAALAQLGAKSGPRGEVLTLSGKALGPGASKLPSSVTTELQHVVAVLQDYPKADLMIDGYTDNRGSAQRNDRISLEHADAVKYALVKDGLEATRVTARGLGPADPVADNHTRAGREENRRTELVFSDSAGHFAAGESHKTSS